VRLFELTNSLTPDKFAPKQVARPGDANFGMENQEELGSGKYATAFSTEQEPGTVRKISNIMDQNEFRNDAYFKYIQMLAKNDRFTSNSYFPKIFDVQVKQIPLKPNSPDTYYDYAYAVDMERLHSLEDADSLSQKEGRMLGNKIFHDFERTMRHHIKNNTIRTNRPKVHPKEEPKHTNWVGALMDTIDVVIDSVHTSNTATIIKDVEFKKAMLLLRSLRQKTKSAGSHMFFDLHSGNIMVRRGPGGPQLVFTDPVAN
jgi:hypothetical protein